MAQPLLNPQQLATLRGEFRTHEPMSLHTSWQAGGKADYFYQPADFADLSQFLAYLPRNENILWMGLGSNSLIRDGGFRGTVISTQKNLNRIEQIDDMTVRAEAGVSCATLARYCARLNLSGLEFLAGVPGTIGGALAMNAGCHGGETWERVVKVDTINREGMLQKRGYTEYRIGYRSVVGVEDEWFAAGYFQLLPGEKSHSLEIIRELLDKRTRTQPINEPNAGSTFRNPPDDYAGRLIEASGLKGACIGGARISEKHANFIVNTGQATAADIEALIQLIMTKVEEVHGVKLILEVRIVGETS